LGELDFVEFGAESPPTSVQDNNAGQGTGGSDSETACAESEADDDDDTIIPDETQLQGHEYTVYA
jgi:hypothetical protein